MSYAQVVQNPPPPMQNAKGGKGKGQYGKGHMAGRGGGQQIVATPPTPKDLQPITWAVGTPLGLEIVGFVMTHKGHTRMTTALAPIIPEMRDKAK